jgi:hypothetical protein
VVCENGEEKERGRRGRGELKISSSDLLSHKKYKNHGVKHKNVLL